MKRAISTAVRPLRRIVKGFSRVMRSCPNTMEMIFLRAKATGTSARALRPMIPSARKSTPRPVRQAMTIAPVVPMLRGMHRTIAGRRVAIIQGVNTK